MKKRILTSMLLLGIMTCLVACKGDGDRTTDETKVPDTSVQEETVQDEAPAEDGGEEETATGVELDSVAILADVWETYGEDEKFYAMGGDMNNMVENAPALYGLEDREALSSMLLVPADWTDSMEEAASLLHGMNANVFTGAVFSMKNPDDRQAFAEALKENLINNQWMCGSPDQYVIYSVGDKHVVMAFGAMDVLGNFKEKFATIHGEYTTVLQEGNVAQ